MFENLRRGRQARNFTTNVTKILDINCPPNRYFPKLVVGRPCKVAKITNRRIYIIKERANRECHTEKNTDLCSARKKKGYLTGNANSL